jgi:hypothetical protein
MQEQGNAFEGMSKEDINIPEGTKLLKSPAQIPRLCIDGQYYYLVRDIVLCSKKDLKSSQSSRHSYLSRLQHKINGEWDKASREMTTLEYKFLQYETNITGKKPALVLASCLWRVLEKIGVEQEVCNALLEGIEPDPTADLCRKGAATPADEDAQVLLPIVTSWGRVLALCCHRYRFQLSPPGVVWLLCVVTGTASNCRPLGSCGCSVLSQVPLPIVAS